MNKSFTQGKITFMGAEYLSCYKIIVSSPLNNPCSALSENTLYSPSTTAFTVVLVQKYFRLALWSLSRAQCALDILSYLFHFFRFFLAGIFGGNSPLSLLTTSEIRFHLVL